MRGWNRDRRKSCASGLSGGMRVRMKAMVRGLVAGGIGAAVLAALHELSGGATLRVNEALAVSNARVAGMIAGRI